MSCGDIVFSNRTLPSICREPSIIALSTVWIVWKFPWNLLGQFFNLNVTHFQQWKLHLMIRNVPLEFCIIHYLATLFRSSSYVYILSEAPTVLCFHMIHQMTLSLFVLPQIPFLTLSSTLILIWSFHCTSVTVHRYLF